MKLTSLFFFLLICALFFVSCNEICCGEQPEYRIRIESISTDAKSATIKWENLGEGYVYSLRYQERIDRLYIYVCSEENECQNDTILQPELRTVAKFENINDTEFTISNLSPNTEYLVELNARSELREVIEYLSFRTKKE